MLSPAATSSSREPHQPSAGRRSARSRQTQPSMSAPTGTPAPAPSAAEPSGPPDEFMKIAQLRFSASQGKAEAGKELLELIEKRGALRGR